MLKDLDFAEKYIIFVLAKRREPIDKGVSPLFSCENAQKNHCFTKHIEKFICRSGFSICFCGNFSGQVGARNGDIGIRKVKIHLFSTLHFFHFRVLLGCYWQNKNLKNPLHLMQNVSDKTFDAVAVRKSLSKLSDFQSVTASPYRVLHQMQGDKQEINTFSSEEVHHPVVCFH